MPTRIDKDLFDEAALAAARHHRSAAQQLNYWARLGREFERSSAVTLRDVERLLAGELAYDCVGEREQAVVRTEWELGIAEDIEALDLAAEFRSSGAEWVEADASGQPVVRR